MLCDQIASGNCESRGPVLGVRQSGIRTEQLSDEGRP